MIRTAFTFLATLIVFASCAEARHKLVQEAPTYRFATDIQSGYYEHHQVTEVPQHKTKKRISYRQQSKPIAKPYKAKQRIPTPKADDHISIYQEAEYAFGSSSSAPWLSTAKQDVGSGASELGVRRNLWCAAAMNHWLRKAGYQGTGSDMASSFADYGSPTSPRAGAIAVMSRGRRGGHVGIVLADKGTHVLLLSGNHSNRVKVALYPKSRIYAYRWPTSGTGTQYASN